MLLQPVAKIVKTPWTNSAFITFIGLTRRNLVQKTKKMLSLVLLAQVALQAQVLSGGREIISQARHLKCLTLQLPRSH